MRPIKKKALIDMLKARFATFLKYKDLLLNLVSRDIKVKYRRSVLGIAWSVLRPVLTMLVMAAVFSRIMRVEVENYALFIITGQLLYSFFSEATTGAMFSVVGASGLIKKVYIPKYIFPFEKTLFAFVNLLLSMVAIVVIMLIQRVAFTATALLFFVPLITLMVFALGAGLILSSICVFFRDLQHIYEVFLTMLVYLTPIIYPRSQMDGSPLMRTILAINPLTWYVEYFRDVLIYGKLPTLEMNLACFGFAAVFLIAGTLIFKKVQDKFILNI